MFEFFINRGPEISVLNHFLDLLLSTTKSSVRRRSHMCLLSQQSTLRSLPPVNSHQCLRTLIRTWPNTLSRTTHRRLISPQRRQTVWLSDCWGCATNLNADAHAGRIWTDHKRSWLSNERLSSVLNSLIVDLSPRLGSTSYSHYKIWLHLKSVLEPSQHNHKHFLSLLLSVTLLWMTKTPFKVWYLAKLSQLNCSDTLLYKCKRGKLQNT